MTKAIEEELGLPSLADALKEIQDASGETPEANAEVEQVANALQNVNPRSLVPSDPTGTADHEMEVDEIYDVAMRAHKDLLDLGFNIESKHAGANAFTPAMKALEIALKASQSKATKKMERIKLIMEQEAHKRAMGEGVEDGEIVDNGQTITANRNDLMEKIRKGEI